jgi:hypothetical protein
VRERDDSFTVHIEPPLPVPPGFHRQQTADFDALAPLGALFERYECTCPGQLVERPARRRAWRR